MADNYSMKTRDDGVVVFRLPNQTRETINCWLEDLARLGKAWIEGELALLLIDMRGSGIVTPYSAESLQKVSRAIAATDHIKTAFVFDPGPPMLLSDRVLHGLGPLLGNKRAFSEEDKAIAWLWRDVN